MQLFLYIILTQRIARESKLYILRVTWLDDGIDYNTVQNLSAFLDVTVDGVQQIT